LRGACIGHISFTRCFDWSLCKARGALLGNRTNPEEARELGRAAVLAKAERFALSVAPIIAGIVAGGVGTDAGIPEALNARGVATVPSVVEAKKRQTLDSPPKIRCAPDSPPEGTGFEPSVPRGKGPTLRVSVLFRPDFSIGGNQPEAT
jgi:hypothetical protein